MFETTSVNKGRWLQVLQIQINTRRPTILDAIKKQEDWDEEQCLIRKIKREKRGTDFLYIEIFIAVK